MMPRCRFCGCDYPAGHGELCFLNPDNIKKCKGCKSLMRKDTTSNEKVDINKEYHSVECEGKFGELK
jgi:hypothetical protein